MLTITKKSGHIEYRWLGDYALLYRNGKVRSRHGSFDEMWAAWEKLKLAYIYWRNEKTQASCFDWVS